MRILLIYPPITRHKADVSPPSKSALIGLGYIGAVLQREGYQVKILDCLTSSYDNFAVDQDFRRCGLSDQQIREKIEDFKPDLVGISCMYTPYFKDAHNIARIVKEYNKYILVVFGGAHASAFPEQTIKDTNVDILVIGEGEDTICEVLSRYEAGKGFKGVKGIIYRNNAEITREEPRGFIEDLDRIPFPAWELLEEDMRRIQEEQKTNNFLMRRPIGYILTSRGCPKECYFCSVKLMWGRQWHMRSAKNVVDEIEFLKDKYGYREFNFLDDNSSVSKTRIYELCDEIIKRELDIRLVTPTGIAIETLDKEILARMKKAGFYRLCFGIESGNQESQKIIKKRINLERAREVIAQSNELGFWTAATFIIGFLHEGEEEIRETIEFAKKSGLDFAVFYLLVPQPGTEVYNIFKEQGLINLDEYIDPYSDQWYKISTTYSNGVKTHSFSNKELQGMLSGAYREFLIHKALSLKTYANLLKKVKSFEDFSYLLRLSIIPFKMLANALKGKQLSNIAIRQADKELKNVA